MKARSVSRMLATMAVLCTFGTSLVSADNTTDPAGFVSVSVPARSDAVLAVPLYRAPVFHGGIQSISGNVITLSSAPDWTSNAFVKGAIPSQNDSFAVLIATGSKEGMIAKVTANGTNTLTLEFDLGDSLDEVKTEALNPGAADQIDIMPYWTPRSLLGPTLAAGTQVLLFPTNQSGINIDAQVTLTKASDAWLNGTADADHMPLFFGQGFVLRNETHAAQVIKMVGTVPMAMHRYVLKKNSAAGAAQDIRIGYSSPVPEAIGNVHLGFTAGDQLLVFDNGANGKNKSAMATLVYNGTAWYRGATNVSASFQLQPGQGYVFRRAPAAPAGNTTWVTIQSYLQ